MITRLRSDIADYPLLFQLSGPQVVVEELIRELGEIPDDLIQFWKEFGGGDIFESETILLPFGTDSVQAATVATAKRGLSTGHFVFHVGVCLSTWANGRFHALEPNSLALLGSYLTLDSWYIQNIRSEYAQRYGLTSTS